MSWGGGGCWKLDVGGDGWWGGGMGQVWEVSSGGRTGHGKGLVRKGVGGGGQWVLGWPWLGHPHTQGRFSK